MTQVVAPSTTPLHHHTHHHQYNHPSSTTTPEDGGMSEYHPPQFEHAKHVYVYLNGDRYYPGRKFIVNRKYLHDFDGFLTEVTRGIKPQFGAVRNIYTPTNGSKINGLEEIQDNMQLVAGGIEKFRRMGYRDITERPRMMHNAPRKTSTTRVPPKNRLQVPGRWRAYVKEPCQIYVYGNGDIIAPALKLLLTPRQMKSWDLILQHITEKIGGRTGQAVRKLYDIEYHMLHDPQELETGHFYIAVGTEKLKRLPYGHIPSFTSKNMHPHQISPRRPTYVKRMTEGKDERHHHPLPPIKQKASKETYSKLQQRRRLTDETVEADSLRMKLKRQPQPPTTVQEDESVFHAKPVKVKRSPQQQISEEQGTIFRGDAVDAVEADEVIEDENTKVDVPIDQVPAARVEEEIITSARDINDSVIIGTDENANNIKESLEESEDYSDSEGEDYVEEEEGIVDEGAITHDQSIEEEEEIEENVQCQASSAGSFPMLVPAASASSHVNLGPVEVMDTPSVHKSEKSSTASHMGYPSLHSILDKSSAHRSQISQKPSAISRMNLGSSPSVQPMSDKSQLSNKSSSKSTSGSSYDDSKFSTPSTHSSQESMLEMEEEGNHCGCVDKCNLACQKFLDPEQLDEQLLHPDDQQLHDLDQPVQEFSNISIRKSDKVSNLSLYKQENAVVEPSKTSIASSKKSTKSKRDRATISLKSNTYIPADPSVASSKKSLNSKQSKRSNKSLHSSPLSRLSSKISSILMKAEDPYNSPSRRRQLAESNSRTSNRSSKHTNSSKKKRPRQDASRLSTVPERSFSRSSNIPERGISKMSRGTATSMTSTGGSTVSGAPSKFSYQTSKLSAKDRGSARSGGSVRSGVSKSQVGSVRGVGSYRDGGSVRGGGTSKASTIRDGGTSKGSIRDGGSVKGSIRDKGGSSKQSIRERGSSRMSVISEQPSHRSISQWTNHEDSVTRINLASLRDARRETNANKVKKRKDKNDSSKMKMTSKRTLLSAVADEEDYDDDDDSKMSVRSYRR